MKFVPRQYQIVGAKFLKDRQFAMLGDAPGVGKTGQAIIAANDLKLVKDTLIVVPSTVKIQWQKALLDWADLSSVIINTGRDIIPQKRIVLISYELISSPRILAQLLKMRFRLIIFDEAHKLKSPEAKRSVTALGRSFLLPRAVRIWFLTGTPIKNRTVDFFIILKTCAAKVLGAYNTYLKFVYRYCGAYKGKYGLDVSGASHTEELHEQIKPFMLRREKREVLTELPPRVITKVDLPCSPAVKRIIEEEELQTIEQAGERDPALFQLGEQVRIRKALAKYKVPVSVKYIEDLLESEEKIVVFFYHKEVLRELRRHFEKVPSVFVDGSVHPNKRSGIVEDFRVRKDLRLFFGQMEACGEGIDGLQAACSTCVFVEPSWSHTDIEQCIGRLERSGQRNDVNVHILVIEDTIESRMMDVVAMKLNVDKKLYNQNKGEVKMAKKLEPMERLAVSMESIAVSLEKLSNPVIVTDGAPQPQPQAAAPVEVEVVVEEVTDDAVRARAGDVCALIPDGAAKVQVVALIKKIGGGKLDALKTPEKRKEALEALDKLYDELDV